ncbi:hypothetical protein [Cohnella sp. JJ-181]|uniref:hypothetical protein n=1 Tax=Cohnella rhizoplanae TaxID=2974897 RepID=UPI0022FF78EA|nr:hypothetical protein [Cohnella sp. JJ-181]CAI6068151.1 hypothetical protein COHCIP112018_02168 [Cohnella sp. JJ-181]
MKSKSIIAKIAVTAMAVTALASPVAAFAAAGPALSKQYAVSLTTASAKSSQIAAGEARPISPSAVVQLTDPVEVAAKYAPDAVQEWKDTLASYAKLAQGKNTLTLSAAALPAVSVPSSDGTAHAVNAVSLQKGILTASGSGTITLQAVKAASVGNLQTVGTLTPRAGITVVTTAAAAAPGGVGLLQGRIALGEAVRTDDAEKIGLALDKLLAQYKTAIAELKQAE